MKGFISSTDHLNILENLEMGSNNYDKLNAKEDNSCDKIDQSTIETEVETELEN